MIAAAGISDLKYFREILHFRPAFSSGGKAGLPQGWPGIQRIVRLKACLNFSAEAKAIIRGGGSGKAKFARSQPGD